LKVVFATNDRDEDAFMSYFKEMSFDLAIPFDDAHIQNLMKKFRISGIPTLIVLDNSGHLITKEGREALSRDADGAHFPWRGAGAEGGGGAEGEAGGCIVA
jgi:nucleoredoxin